jgi:hypothetical protein
MGARFLNSEQVAVLRAAMEILERMGYSDTHEAAERVGEIASFYGSADTK